MGRGSPDRGKQHTCHQREVSRSHSFSLTRIEKPVYAGLTVAVASARKKRMANAWGVELEWIRNRQNAPMQESGPVRSNEEGLIAWWLLAALRSTTVLLDFYERLLYFTQPSNAQTTNLLEAIFDCKNGLFRLHYYTSHVLQQKQSGDYHLLLQEKAHERVWESDRYGQV